MGNCISHCCCSIKAVIFPKPQNTIMTPYKQEKEVEITTVRVDDYR